MDKFVYPPCTTPALPKGIPVLLALLLATEVLLRGEWKGKTHVNLLFATYTRWVLTWSEAWVSSFPGLPLVATCTAIWSSIQYDLLERQCSLLLGLAGVRCCGKPASTCTEIEIGLLQMLMQLQGNGGRGLYNRVSLPSCMNCYK